MLFIINKNSCHFLFITPGVHLWNKALNTSAPFFLSHQNQGFKSLQFVRKADWHLSAHSSNFGVQKARKQLIHKAFSLWHLYCLRVLEPVNTIDASIRWVSNSVSCRLACPLNQKVRDTISGGYRSQVQLVKPCLDLLVDDGIHNRNLF